MSIVQESISLKRDTVHVRIPTGASFLFLLSLLLAPLLVLEVLPNSWLLFVITRCASAVDAKTNISIDNIRIILLISMLAKLAIIAEIL